MLGRAGTRQIGTRNSQRHDVPRRRNVPISVCIPSERGTTGYGGDDKLHHCSKSLVHPRRGRAGGIPICAGIHDKELGIARWGRGRSWQAGRIRERGLSFYAANSFVAVSLTTDQNGLKCLGVFPPLHQVPLLVDWLFPSRIPRRNGAPGSPVTSMTWDAG
jgi:hypothetical protein